MTSTFCPVPEEQQPLNEYRQLQESWFFSWACREGFAYGKPLLLLGLLGFIVFVPIASFTFPPAKAPIGFLSASLIAGGIPASLGLVQLFFGWRHVRDRLQSDKVFYEESGWYDGQVWVKPTEVLNRDRLIASYEIQPLMNKVRTSLFSLLAVMVTAALLIALNPDALL